MASNILEKITVSKLTKYGFQIQGSDDFINYSKQLKESDKTKIVPGAEFDVEFYVADSGKRYLNKIVLTSANQTEAVFTASQNNEPKKVFTPKFNKPETAVSSTMSKDEWKAKDRSQLIGGLSHDAATITAAAVQSGLWPSLDSHATVVRMYKDLLEEMIRIREVLK